KYYLLDIPSLIKIQDNAVFENCTFIDCIISKQVKKKCKDCIFIKTCHNYSFEEYFAFDSINSIPIFDNQSITFDDYQCFISSKTDSKSIKIDKYLATFYTKIASNGYFDNIFKEQSNINKSVNYKNIIYSTNKLSPKL